MSVNRLRKKIAIITGFLLLTTALSTAQPRVNVATLFDGPWTENSQLYEMFTGEILTLTSGEFNIDFPQEKQLTADWTQEGVDRALSQLLSDPQVDMVLAMGIIASQKASRRTDLPKPVIAPFVIDIQLQDLPRKNGASGIKNLNYIAIPSTIERDVKAFKSIVDFKQLTVFLNGAILDGLPNSEDRIRKSVALPDITTRVIAVYRLEDALSALTPETEAVYIAPLFHLPEGNFQRIIDELIDQKIPSFSLMGRREVEQGIFAALNPVIFPRMARRIALNVQRILLGEDAGTIPYAFPAAQELSINMATARKIGVYPSWGVITEAILIQEQRETVERELSLKTTLLAGIDANLDLVAKNHEVAAGEQTVRQALANLLPQIDLSATALQIDADRAGLFQAEQTLNGSATLTQVLFSDDALTNHSVQTNLQNALVQDRNAFRLDIAAEIATSYLQLLSAKTFEKIVKDNLQLSHSNLELARIRESIGYSGRAEVYRWESEISTNRKTVIEANARRNIAEMQVNRLLHRPLEEKFVTAENGMSTAELLKPHRRILRYMDNPWAFKNLRLFLVNEGIASSPEIQQLDAAISAQVRILKNANRSFFLPDLVAQAEFSRLFLEEGKGSEPVGNIPGFDTGDDNNWSVALNLNFPLYSGGAKFAARGNALESLHQLRTERKSLVDKIEQRVRSAAHSAGATYAGIEQSQNAADAARKNLDLVRDAYSRGVISITQLLDAQNAALIADQSAADAVYAFLIDLIELERAFGSILMVGEVADVDALFNRMDAFYEVAGVSVNKE